MSNILQQIDNLREMDAFRETQLISRPHMFPEPPRPAPPWDQSHEDPS